MVRDRKRGVGMKSRASLIISFIIIFMFSQITMANNELDIQISEISEREAVENIKNVSWDGKEWITNEYPPRISEDGINFTEITGTEQVKSLLKNYSVGYLWTGSDYLVYHITHDYRQYQNNKNLYRLSADMNTVIDTYIVPDWINYIAIIDNICYIATENVYPLTASDTDRVYGERKRDFAIYYSNDFENWFKIDMMFDENNLGYMPSMYKVGNKIFVADYINPELNQYTKQCKNAWMISKDNSIQKVEYESITPMGIGKSSGFLYTQLYYGKQNVCNIAFSADGIYWTTISANYPIFIENIYEKQDIIVIKGVSNNKTVYYGIDKEQFDSIILQNFVKDQMYVQLNDRILGFDNPPVVEDDMMLVPIRFLFEQMGADVEWDQATKTATATLNNDVISFPIDDTNAHVNGENATMDVPARLIDDKTMVPLRFLSENLGYTVTWNEDTRTAVIDK